MLKQRLTAKQKAHLKILAQVLMIITNLAKEASANQAANELEVALKSEIDKGLVSVERKDGKVFVTVGSGGAFSSGSAELTTQAGK